MPAGGGRHRELFPGLQGGHARHGARPGRHRRLDGGHGAGAGGIGEMMDGFDALKTVAGLPADFEDRLDWGILREGVEISWICNGGETAASAAFLRYAPGAMVPRHHHPMAEYVLTLRGSQEDARGKHPA